MNDPNEEMVVMATTDEIAISIARDILDKEGIKYSLGGAGLRRFGGSTFLGASLGPLMGETLIKVPAYLAHQARELLQGLSGADELDEGTRPPKPA
jgi:hypothetical protein